jgi:hypothetical protein
MWPNIKPKKIISFIFIWDLQDAELKDVGSSSLLDPHEVRLSV